MTIADFKRNVSKQDRVKLVAYLIYYSYSNRGPEGLLSAVLDSYESGFSSGTRAWNGCCSFNGADVALKEMIRGDRDTLPPFRHWRDSKFYKLNKLIE
jgi:hypothetical protein